MQVQTPPLAERYRVMAGGRWWEPRVDCVSPKLSVLLVPLNRPQQPWEGVAISPLYAKKGT